MNYGILPEVDFCGLSTTRLVLGGNPFAGFSHQSQARDEEMKSFSTVEAIKETWSRAEAAGLNTMVTNNENPRVVAAVHEYLAGGGRLRWFAQVKDVGSGMLKSIDSAVRRGCSAMYFHGAAVDRAYRENDEKAVTGWFDRARAHGIPVGAAAHDPAAHLWVDRLGVSDFHAVSLFNCGSLHSKKFGSGYKFRLADIPGAIECIRTIKKPCIAYKIMAAGRIDPRMAFEYALENIKPGDIVNVGMHRGDKDDMVEENTLIVREILERI